MFHGDFLSADFISPLQGGHCYMLSRQKAHRHFPQGFSDTTYVCCSITVLLSQGLSRQLLLV